MFSTEAYRDLLTAHLQEKIKTEEPKNLYEPMVYILNLGGKRLRPVLTLLATDLFGGDHKLALDAALAVEIFHNFSLVHDDIMDDAPIRRGKPTVHELWDVNTGILSGDVMLIIAYQLFENYEPKTFRDLATLFSHTAVKVCEGQQYDVDFENRDDVSISEYLTMITYKTAVLLGAALQMGAIIGNATEEQQHQIYDIGINLGIAFQLMDDYLDAFGDEKTFGKKTGGDIIENKKTFLYLKTLDNLDTGDAAQLRHLYSVSPEDPESKIVMVKELMQESGAVDETVNAISEYTQKAMDLLDRLEVPEEGKDMLRKLASGLMRRKV
ncbi:polyprenyl synthetase family protein [Robertkochia solimangrovi]|uniref:polyprenyl synthetase family protein n=1 Tax=Robertkochia solimangrovi TaxID=2213046 RepID=UPI00117E49F5|nr:polyprenyl synthetase family protein [Robertkochia solimangrovi]TRZ46262.1 polyprenyl synthetase family protein [Robertkochia solimangrovi]